MHPGAYGFVQRAAALVPSRGPVYEIGSRIINGGVREIFHGRDFLGLDVAPGQGVDVVADGATYDPRPLLGPPSTVVCCEVLEHTPAALDIVTQAARVLAPGGTLIVTCATDGRAPHSAVHGGPLQPGEYYANVSDAAVLAHLAVLGLEVLGSLTRHDIGDFYVVARKAGDA